MYYVEKKLALGPIRFAVDPRRPLDAADEDPSLSTGAGGEFIRRRADGGFFFGDASRFVAPTLPKAKSITSLPFWTSLKRHVGFLALMAAGVVFILLGFAVLVRKGAAGWVEIILGLAMIGTPIFLTAKERQAIREREERERAEREAQEKRNREMLDAYAAALERACRERDDRSFAQLEQERDALTLPYELWSSSAHRAVLLAAFDELARWGTGSAREVARLIDRAGAAAGLSADDIRNVKIDLYSTLAWHLFADNRIGYPAQTKLAEVREGFGIDDSTNSALDASRRVRGAKLHPITCSRQLGFRETCLHEAGALHVTNKRVLLDGKKPVEIPLAGIDEVTVDVDGGALNIRAAKPLRVPADDPIYTAAVIDLAEEMEPRPKGFA